MAISEPRGIVSTRGSALVLLICLLAHGWSTRAQPTDTLAPPATQESVVTTHKALLPSASLAAALEQVEDFRFDFDQPAFYEAVVHIRLHGDALHAQPALEIADWRDLLERPRDFRGRIVRVRGYVGANRAWTLQSWPDLGTLHQLELYADGAPLAVTLIATEDLSDLPIGAEIEAAGMFVMMRSYYSRTNQVRPAALIVCAGPTRVATGAPLRAEGGSVLWWMVAILLGGLAAVWMIFRSNTRARRTPLESLKARHPVAQNVADDLQKWVAEEDAHRHP